jgi:hypothetical protein
LLLLVGAAGLTLPWWLPPGLVRDALQRDLSAQAGVSVSIERVELGWSGVAIRGLVIASPEGFGPQALATVRTVRAEFAPFKMLFGGKLTWMSLHGPRYHIRTNAAGQLNLDPLLALQLPAESLSLRDGVASLRLWGNPRPAVLNIHDMQLRAGPLDGLGEITLSGVLHQQGEPAPLSLRMTAHQRGSPQAADAALFFSNLDLAQIDLPDAWIDQIPIRSMKGHCSGKLTFGMNSDLKIDQLSCEILASRLEVQPAGADPLPVIAEAGLRLRAGIDAYSEKVTIHHISLRLPGLDVQGQGAFYADVLLGEVSGFDRLELAGQVHPDRLATVLLGRRELLGELALHGPVAMRLASRRIEDALRLRVSLDAARASIRLGGQRLKQPDRPFALVVNGDLRRRGAQWGFDLNRGTVDLPGCRLATTGDLTDLGALGRAVRTVAEGAGIGPALRALRQVHSRGTIEFLDVASLPGENEKSAGRLSGTWALEGGELPRISLALRSGAERRLVVGGLLAKPVGQELILDAAAVIDPDRLAVHQIVFDLTCEQARLSVDDTVLQFYDHSGLGQPAGGRIGDLRGRFEFQGLDDLAGLLPAVGGNLRLGGSLSGQLSGVFRAGTASIGLQADLTNVDLRVGDQFLKSPGDPLSAQLGWQQSDDGGGRLNRWMGRLSNPQVSGQFALARRELTPHDRWTGQLELTCRDAAWLQASSPALDRALGGGWISGPCRLDGHLRSHGGHTRLEASLSPPREVDFLDGRKKRINLQLDGQARLQASIGPADPHQNRPITLAVDLQALELAEVLGLAKPAGVEADLFLKGNWDASDVLHLQTLEAELATARLKAIGHLPVGPAGLAGPASGTVNLRADRCEPLREIFVDTPVARLAGGVELTGRLHAHDGTLGGRLKVRTDRLEGRYRGQDLLADGTLSLAGQCRRSGYWQIDQLLADGLELRVGKNHGWVIADLQTLPQRPSGRVRLLLEYLDDKDLADWLRGRVFSAPSDLTIDQARRDQLLARAHSLLEQARPYLDRSDLSVQVQADRYDNFDYGVQQYNQATTVHIQLQARQGQATLSYDAGLNGGTISGTLETTFADPVPMVRIASEINEVQAAENIQPQIARFFPGNTVEGLFSRSERVVYPLRQLVASALDARCRPYPEGTAKMVALDGVLRGRSAPRFVTKVFPGLNLTEYHYRKMTSFARYLPDGSSENEMIFDGVYDVYITGETDPDNYARYTLGLVLLPPASAEWQYDWKQGRFPVLKVRGLIRGSQLLDEEVSYPWPNETLFEVFLANNIVYRAWVNIKEKHSDPFRRP